MQTTLQFDLETFWNRGGRGAWIWSLCSTSITSQTRCNCRTQCFWGSSVANSSRCVMARWAKQKCAQISEVWGFGDPMVNFVQSFISQLDLVQNWSGLRWSCTVTDKCLSCLQCDWEKTSHHTKMHRNVLTKLTFKCNSILAWPYKQEYPLILTSLFLESW